MLSFLTSMLADVLPARETAEPVNQGVHFRDILGAERVMIEALRSRGFVATEVCVHKRNWYARVAGQGWMNVNKLLKGELVSATDLITIIY